MTFIKGDYAEWDGVPGVVLCETEDGHRWYDLMTGEVSVKTGAQLTPAGYDERRKVWYTFPEGKK